MIKLSTPSIIRHFFYLAIAVGSRQGEEQFGISIGRIYLGLYDGRPAIGVLDQSECLAARYC